MTGSRFAWLALALVAAPGYGIAGAQPEPAPVVRIIVSPEYVVAGSPELIRIEGVHADGVDGEWLGRPIEFFRGRDGWIALAGADVEAAPGPSEITIHLHGCREKCDIGRPVEIHPAHYRTTELTVSPRFTSPSPEELKVIDADIEIKKRVFAASAAQPLWRGNFRAPVRAAPTDSFGTRRVFNSQLDSVHKGMDFRARMGTLVRASNSGVVVLARPLYFEGNCVIIDHGQGLFTISMHLSRFFVHDGQRVVTGQRIGLSGATGRVTGPHLHWAVRWQGAYLDPAKLLRMNLSTVR